MRARLTTAAEIAGLSLIAVGVSTFSPSLGLIVAGAFVALIGYLEGQK